MSDLRLLRKLAKFPKSYLSPKIAAGTIGDKRLMMEKAKARLVTEAAVREFIAKRDSKAKSMSPLQFLEATGFPKDRAEEISKYFGSLAELVSASETEFQRIHGIQGKEIQYIQEYQQKFTAGVWPWNQKGPKYRKPIINTAAKQPQRRQALRKKPWTSEDDSKLLSAVSKYNADFGDVWIYVSFELRRSPEDCRHRFIEIELREKNRKISDWRFTVPSFPLFLNRHFKKIPETLVIIPTVKNFPENKETEKIDKKWLSYL